MKDVWNVFVEEMKTLLGTRAAWFLLGLSLSGATVPTIVDAVKQFAGV